MITLGITGRSGCGKSTVTAVFAAHGVPLADADQLSREILLPGSPLLPQLAARFGGEILRPTARWTAVCWLTAPLPPRRARPRWTV